MSTNYSGNGSKPSLPIVLVDDGEDFTFTTFMVACVEKMIDWLSSLEAGNGQVAAYSGTVWTITAGPVLDFLKALADHAAKLDAAAHFTSSLTVDGIAALTLATVQNSLSLADGATFSRGATSISASATTCTIDPTVHALVDASAWSGAGQELAATLALYTGAINPEAEFRFSPTHPGAVCALTVSGAGAPLVVLTGAATVRFRWPAGTGTGPRLLTPPGQNVALYS